MLAMKLFLYLFFFLMVSCSTHTRTSGKSDPRKSVSVFYQLLQSKHIQGNKAFLDYNQKGLEKKLGIELATFILDEIKSLLRSRSFTLVDERSKAHLVLYITTDSFFYTPTGWEPLTSHNLKGYDKVRIKSKGSHEVAEDNRAWKNPYLSRISLTALVQEWSKRPVTTLNLSFTAEDQDWVRAGNELKLVFPQELEKLALTAPAVDQVMQGDPGCIPRFGFVDKAVPGMADEVIITRVISDSAAEAIGLAKGDVILRVDSIPYPQFSTSSHAIEVYEQKRPVEIVFKRKKKIYTRTLKARLDCFEWQKRY